MTAFKSLPRIILASSILALAPQVFAQAPGVPIEMNHKETGEAEVLNKLAKLREEGKLFGLDKIKAQLAAPQGGAVELVQPKTDAIKPREVVERARAGYVQVGWYFLCNNCDRWHLNIAGGYAIAKDAVATCNHCVEPDASMRDAYLIAIDHTGEIVPITGIIAHNKSMDAAILRVGAGNFTPLALNDQVAPGDASYCFSKPLGQENYFSDGIINRFFWRSEKHGQAGSIEELESLRMNVSTDWAPGSSGSAVVDASGNVIGHVSTIATLNKGGGRAPSPKQPAPVKADDKAEEGKKAEAPKSQPQPQPQRQSGSPTLITLHEATPARCVISLAKAAGTKTQAPASGSVPSAAINSTNAGIPCAGEAAAAAAEAPAVTLHIGDAAPKLAGKWIKGEPVAEFSKDKVYMVEFWATWCGPCKQNIPHLTELQKKFAAKGLIVIGQSIREPDAAKVEPFVKEMGDKMDYRVAVDSIPEGASYGDGEMVKTWMNAAGRKGIPSAFLVGKDGKIAWMGHPAELSDSIMEEVLAGKFDVAAAKAKAEAAMKADTEFEKVRAQLVQAIKEQNWEEASKCVDQWEKLAPGKPVVFRGRMEVALGSKSGAAVNSLLEKLISTRASGRMATEMVGKIEAAPKFEGIDWALAEKLLRQGAEYTKGADRAPVLDALARVIFRGGRQDEAVKTQEEAIAAAGDDMTKRRFSNTLDGYKAGKAPAVKN